MSKDQILDLIEKHWVAYVVFWFGLGFILSYCYFK